MQRFRRAARNGDAFTLVTRDDRAMVGAIERILGGRVEHRTVDGFNYAATAQRRKNEVGRAQGRRVRGHRRAFGTSI